jgi:hypothetical protein
MLGNRDEPLTSGVQNWRTTAAFMVLSIDHLLSIG